MPDESVDKPFKFTTNPEDRFIHKSFGHVWTKTSGVWRCQNCMGWPCKIEELRSDVGR